MRSTASAPVLRAERVSVRFGGIQALDAVSLHVEERQICGLIGPNGAGKTTFFNAVTRLGRLTSGTIELRGRRIERVKRRDIIRMGVARTFQNVGIFAEMSVIENVMLGAHHETGGRYLEALLRPGRASVRDRETEERCLAILEDLGLADLARRAAGSLPYPQQKRMEVARALAAGPTLLMLDEPAGGLAHGEVAAFGRILSDVRKRYSLSILLIEHHMGLVLGLCDAVHVFHLGRNLAFGPPDQIKSDPAVVAAYLGRGA